ncbi:MAG: hypothetical protein AB1411_15755 [Nitrospirota bacterium]
MSEISMRFEPLRCPACGRFARGNIDRIPALAVFTEPDASGGVVYAGESDVWWDEAETVRDRRNRVRLVCPLDHEWWATYLNEKTLEQAVKKGRSK